MVRVRIAPSPTGSPHIGTVWQALFDYIFAKKNKGKFILRLEDTDRARYVAKSEGEIYQTLKWLGLTYDEGPDIGGSFGPYKQSERLAIYKDHTFLLLEKGLAYKDEGAVKFKINKEGQTTYHDLVGDRDITLENFLQDDFVILKSDGYPTYNFANVIDDHLMEISHVIRGNEYISSMPKYLQLYQAFNWTPPQFAHFPLLVGSDRSKLSKRHGAKGALEFKKEGYLKDALLNFLMLLGWSHPKGKEIFTIEEAVELFDLKDINPSSAYFDVTKLDWLNGEYIRKTENSKLKSLIKEYLIEISEGQLKNERPTEEDIEKVIPLVKERIKKLSDFIPLTDFLWEKVEYDLEIINKLKIDNVKDILKKIKSLLEKMEEPWDSKEFESNFRNLAQQMNVPVSSMFQLIRVAVSGQLVTPPLFESIQILGEDETLKRVTETIRFLQ